MKPPPALEQLSDAHFDFDWMLEGQDERAVLEDFPHRETDLAGLLPRAIELALETLRRDDEVRDYLLGSAPPPRYR